VSGKRDIQQVYSECGPLQMSAVQLFGQGVRGDRASTVYAGRGEELPDHNPDKKTPVRACQLKKRVRKGGCDSLVREVKKKRSGDEQAS